MPGMIPSAFFALAMAVASSCGGNSKPPLIFAAASLSDVLGEVHEAYREETGREARFSFGGSRALAIQIADLGAPADAAVFAGDSPMDFLGDVGKIVPGSRTGVAGNRLVVVSGGERISGLAELVAAESGALIAIADPQLAPAGEYAAAMLEHAGILDRLSDRMIRTLDVRSALAAVSSGSVEFAIVYQTDAMASRDTEIVLQAPAGSHPIINYPAAVIDGSANAEEAARFIDYLGGDTAMEIFRRHGFKPPQ